MSNTFTAAVVQATPVAFDRDRTVQKVHALASEAAHGGARLVLFPEAFVSAYPRGMDFGAVVGARTAAGREEFRRYWESSVERQRFQAIAIGLVGIALISFVLTIAADSAWEGCLAFGLATRAGSQLRTAPARQSATRAVRTARFAVSAPSQKEIKLWIAVLP